MSKVKIEYVDELPTTEGLYGSMWDEPLDEFVASNKPLAKLPGITTGQAQQIRWAAGRRHLPVKVIVQNSTVYLERITAPSGVDFNTSIE